ncbi:transcription initiation factor TFIID subunit 11-like [Camellia sinensis]|uniref:transcription initiation factor TFIID subunit 11-like n=1 Tax=Camellia sinensis TaxID=4442 RepID=UPI00103695FD|nr:transcription initiation factor TFIID subunit 11-like [Camellia sinensis]XP_028064416.1 transcription initiation factor TFIID subunit 11-like [Camellia sinensis]
MGMVQTSMNLLSLYKIPIPFQTSAPPDAPVGATAGPSVPPPAAGMRGRQILTCSRGRVRGTRCESGLSEPIQGNDDDETSEEDEDEDEVGSPQSESSEGRDDDAGSDFASSEAGEAEEGSGSGSDSDSDSGADGDNALESTPQRKRTNRASRA